MQQIEQSVFISYRRADQACALLVFKHLSERGLDVFVDYQGIGSGDFEHITLQNILSRAHFLVVLTISALERCHEPGDWLHKEITTAIRSRRNIVPLLFSGFSFSSPDVVKQLQNGLQPLASYNGLEVPLPYFDAAMERLLTRYINTPLDAVLHPSSSAADESSLAQQEAAAVAVKTTYREPTKPLAKRLDGQHAGDISVAVFYGTESEVQALQGLFEASERRMQGSGEPQPRIRLKALDAFRNEHAAERHECAGGIALWRDAGRPTHRYDLPGTFGLRPLLPVATFDPDQSQDWHVKDHFQEAFWMHAAGEAHSQTLLDAFVRQMTGGRTEKPLVSIQCVGAYKRYVAALAAALQLAGVNVTDESVYSRLIVDGLVSLKGGKSARGKVFEPNGIPLFEIHVNRGALRGSHSRHPANAQDGQTRYLADLHDDDLAKVLQKAAHTIVTSLYDQS